jgi:glycosyltransferase 2 family protein
MEPAKKPFRPNLILIVLIAGLIAFILYILFYVNPAQVVDTLSKTNLAIYSVAFVTYMLYTFCSSLAWRSLLNNLSVMITRRKAFLFTWVGLFFEATIPQLGWSAEISKTYLLAKDSNVDSGRIGASVVGQKIFTMTLTVAALSAGLALLLLRYSVDFIAALLISLVLVVSIAILAVVYWVSFRPSATQALVKWAIKIILFFRKSWNPTGFRTKAMDMLGSFHLGIDQLRAHPKSLIQPIVYAVVSFVFEVSVLFITFAALGITVQPDVVFIVFTLTGTLQTVGASFFGLPVMTVIFSALGMDPAVAVSAALLASIVNLWFRLVVSYGALQWAGVKIIKQNRVN